MKTKNIEIVVHPNGRIMMEAFHFEGADCEKATKFLEQALGWHTSRVRKPEFYQARNPQAKRQQQLGGGQ